MAEDPHELSALYALDALTGEDLARFETHLAGCRGCRTYLEQMRQTIRALGRLTEDSIEAQAKERLLSVFRGWKRGSA